MVGSSCSSALPFLPLFWAFLFVLVIVLVFSVRLLTGIGSDTIFGGSSMLTDGLLYHLEVFSVWELGWELEDLEDLLVEPLLLELYLA